MPQTKQAKRASHDAVHARANALKALLALEASYRDYAQLEERPWVVQKKNNISRIIAELRAVLRQKSV